METIADTGVEWYSSENRKIQMAEISIERAEDRELFKEMCQSIGEPVIPSEITYSVEEAIKA